MNNRLEILNVDADPGARVRLKQLLIAHCPQAHLTPAQRLSEGLTQLGSGEFDLLIVASDFGAEALAPFMTKVKEMAAGTGLLIVTLLRGRDCNSETVVQNILSGVHGALCEPLSVDDLAGLLEQAGQARNARQASKRTAGLDFLLTDAVKYLDEIAQRAGAGAPSGYNLRNFRKLAATLPPLAEELKEDFHKAIVKCFTAIEKPRYLVRKRSRPVEEAAKPEVKPQAPPQQASRRIIRKR